MSIEKIVRKKGTVYRVTVRTNRFKENRTFDRKIDAQCWERKMRDPQVVQDSHLSPKIDSSTEATTLDQLRERFEKDYAPLRQSPSTLKLEAATYVRYVKPYFGHSPISKIGQEEIEIFFLSLSRKLHVSNGRINRIRILLNGMFNRAVKWKYVRFNPVKGTDPFPTDTKPLDAGFNYLTQEEARNFLDWLQLNDPWLYPKVRVLVNCGLRYGEMVALRVQDVCPSTLGATLRISRTYCRHTFEIRNRTKGRRSRLFPLNTSMAKFLAIQAMGKRKDEPLLWKSWVEFKHVTKFQKHFKKAIKIAGVNPIRIHDLRHAFAVHFLEQGGHLYDLQNLLGHSTSKLTERYSHFSSAMVERSCGIVDHHGDSKPNLTVVDGGKPIEMSPKCPLKLENEVSTIQSTVH